VRKDWPELVTLLDRALDAIDEKERTAIMNTWMAVEVSFGLDRATLIKWAVPIGTAVAIVIGVIIIWNRRLFREIRDRKEAEAMVAEKEAHLRLAMDNMPGGIVYTDDDLNVVVSNSQIFDMLSLPSELVAPGKSYADAIRMVAKRGMFGPGDIDTIVEERLETLRNPTDHPLEVKSPEGFYLSVQRRKAEGGGVVTVATDITERKIAEDKLQDAYDVISDSIRYASSIQRAVLTGEAAMTEHLGEHLLLWQPRDVVGGDIYWCREWGGGVLLILADCTGHGVPGAFMTLIATGALDRAMTEVAPGEMGRLVQRIHQIVQTTLGQDSTEGDSDDGLELGACFVHPDREKMTFCGARFPLFFVENGAVEQVKGTKAGIGYRGIAQDQAYAEHVTDNITGRAFYMTSDGMTDQIGGEKGRMFGKRRLKTLLLEVQDLPMPAQRDRLDAALLDYQGDEARCDDVSVIGFRIG